MNILAISGSTRKESLNSKLLSAIQGSNLPGISIELYSGIGSLPIFNQDLEGAETPNKVLELCEKINHADGIIIASPEYVRTLPGGLKNAIDWLVSREEIIAKPIALAHSSHRGDDMLAELRIVLGTISERFTENVFLRIPLSAVAAKEVSNTLFNEESTNQISRFMHEFVEYINVV